jgi:MOSC domain-containing protein YiiM
MKKRELGKAIELYISKDSGQKREQKELLHVELDGALEDRFKGKDIDRSILLVARLSYELAKEQGIALSSGELGENILCDFDPYSLEAGTRVQVGDVVLEISQKSSLCPSLSKISSKLPKLLKNRRGVFTKVINHGTIRLGDSVYLAS